MNSRRPSYTAGTPRSSNIPLRRQLSRENSNCSNTSTKSSFSEPASRWKQKYEDSEERRKNLLSEKEKLLRNLNDLEKKHVNLQIEHEQLETELFEKNEEFSRLSTASKNLYKEYETLKNQYETESSAMSSALKDASQWYKENKVLRRKTLLLADKDNVDASDLASNDTDIENLNKTIKQLSSDVAELQTELDTIRQTEFQTLEQNVRLTEELDTVKEKNKLLKGDLQELTEEHQRLLRVTDIMKKELKELQRVEDDQRNNIVVLRKQAEVEKRERNVLAHRSALLEGLSSDQGIDSLILLEEIEHLKRTMEEDRTRYEEEINNLQERLESQDNNSHEEILEERLKLVEKELQEALKRADEAEKKTKLAPPPPPPPPPLVPPPPPLPSVSLTKPPTAPLRRRKSRATVEDLVKTIGIPYADNSVAEKKNQSNNGVNEDIINAIKEGKFTLRKPKKESNKDKETPKAVSEILNILSSLKRAPKKRQSQSSSANDSSF